MSAPSQTPRSGRVLDWLVIALLAFVFVGLAVYRYRRIDRWQQNDEKVRELAQESLPEDRTARFDWPQWRGPNRDGISTETDLVTDWPTGGPKLLWEQPLGRGYASVAVVKGRLFTTFLDHGVESIIALNAETGAEIWRVSHPNTTKLDYGNGPRSTPTVAGEYIYAIGSTGAMFCLKAFTERPEGEIIWKKDLLYDFSAPLPRWGVAFSPLVEGDRVYIQPGGPQGNSLAALDKSTGEILWKMHDDPAGYSSPIAATFADERHILFFTADRLMGVDPATGKMLWDYAWPTEFQCNIATPIVVQDYVFISSSYGHGCAVLKIAKTGAAWQPELVYKNTRMRNHFATCVRHGDTLFGFDESMLTALDFRTGRVLWKERGFGKGSVLIANDQLIICGENGILALAETNPREYREKARFTFSTDKAPCWSVPVVANGRLYARDQRKLACYDVKAASR